MLDEVRRERRGWTLEEKDLWVNDCWVGVGVGVGSGGGHDSRTKRRGRFAWPCSSSTASSSESESDSESVVAEWNERVTDGRSVHQDLGCGGLWGWEKEDEERRGLEREARMVSSALWEARSAFVRMTKVC